MRKSKMVRMLGMDLLVSSCSSTIPALRERGELSPTALEFSSLLGFFYIYSPVFLYLSPLLCRHSSQANSLWLPWWRKSKRLFWHCPVSFFWNIFLPFYIFTFTNFYFMPGCLCVTTLVTEEEGTSPGVAGKRMDFVSRSSSPTNYRKRYLCLFILGFVNSQVHRQLWEKGKVGASRRNSWRAFPFALLPILLDLSGPLYFPNNAEVIWLQTTRFITQLTLNK